jgi:hypothetical protein
MIKKFYVFQIENKNKLTFIKIEICKCGIILYLKCKQLSAALLKAKLDQEKC